jgi:hypothetical protein
MADAERRLRAARSIQCFWRVVCAKRKVVNRRLWLWITTRNTIKIQCMFRCHKARSIRRAKEEHRALKRDLLQKNVAVRKLNALYELIHWRGSRCHDAAVTIQRWYREAQAGGFAASASTTFARAIREVQSKREVFYAEIDAERLSSSPLSPAKIPKTVRVAAH